MTTPRTRPQRPGAADRGLPATPLVIPLAVPLALLLALAGAPAGAADAGATVPATAPATAVDPSAGEPAGQRQSLERLRATTLALIDALVGQGLLPRDKADALVRQAQASAPPPSGSAASAAPAWGDPPRGASTPAANVVRVPYLSETVRNALRDEIRNEVLSTAREERWADSRAIPEWTRAITLDGDLRLRWQDEGYRAPGYAAGVTDACLNNGGNRPAECYRIQTGSPAWSPDLSNTTHDRARMTLRARLGAQAKVGEDTTAGIRLSTGSSSGPSSSSQTLGQGFNKASLVLDRAWLRWEPRFDWRLLAGRMANPFFGSDLLWPDDLSLDGLAVQTEQTLASGVYAFAHAGAFPVGEVALGPRDKWLYALQLGIDWSPDSRWQWRTALAVYDFRHIEGVRESALPPTGARAGTTDALSSDYPATLRQKGNTLIALDAPGSPAASTTWGLASRFRPINLSSALTLRHFDPVEATLQLDWVKNSAFDIAEISSRAGTDLSGQLPERSTGLQAKVTVGHHSLANRGNWQAFAALRRLQRDAWIDGFTDTTWHLGGTGYQGWSLGGQYAIDRRTSFGLRLTSTRNLDDGWRDAEGRPNLSSAPLRIDVLQLDLHARF